MSAAKTVFCISKTHPLNVYYRNIKGVSNPQDRTMNEAY
jgi:hypothetical protein